MSTMSFGITVKSLGPVVRKVVSANLELKVKLGFDFSCIKVLKGLTFCELLR